MILGGLFSCHPFSCRLLIHHSSFSALHFSANSSPTFRMLSCFVIDSGSLGPREFFARCRWDAANRVVEVDVVGAHGWPPNRAGKDRSRH